MIVFHPLLIETFPGPVWIQDSAGLVIWSNDTWSRYTGVHSLSSGEYYLNNFHPDDSDRLLMAVIESARVGGWSTLRARIRDARARYGLFSIHLGYYHDPEAGSARWLCIATDLIVSSAPDTGPHWQKALAATVEAAGIGAWDWDLVTDVIEANPSFFRILGLDRSLQDLSYSRFVQFVHEDDRRLLQENIDKAITELGDFKTQCRIIRADGDERWICAVGKINASPRRGLNITGILSDITDRIIRERNKDRFIGIASHEIKTPITSIRAYTQLLKRQIAALPDMEEGLILDRLTVQVERLSDLARILLDTTRISEQQLVLECRWFDLRELVLQCIDTVTPAEQPSRIVYDTGYTGMIYADQERIRQVCTNLLTNALKFSDKEVSVRTWRNEPHAGYAVSDQGIGIPENMIEKIFEPFIQAPGEPKLQNTGLGLGLYISAGIIRKHGGEITVSSKPGQGSVFQFVIPAA